RAFVVRFVRGNREVGSAADDAVGHPSFGGRGIGNGEADERTIDDLLADRCVVDLDRQVAAGRNQLARAERTIVICRSTRHVAVEPAADIRARVTPTAPTTGSRPIVRRRIGALDRRTLIVAWRLGPV